MHKKNINILALVSVLSVAIAFLVTYWRDISDKDNANVKYLFPDLIDQVNEISTIEEETFSPEYFNIPIIVVIVIAVFLIRRRKNQKS